MSYWQPYLISLMIGLLVGIEREKSHQRQQAMGIRTFMLISMLGALSGGLQNTWLSVLLAAFALGLIVISYFNHTHREAIRADMGLTTEFAAGIVFCLGYAAHESPALSAVVGPVVAVLLFSKTSLHRFINALKPSELQAALLLFLAGVVVVNLVPDKTIDPWGVFNPNKFGYLILLLASLEFSSYVLVKVIGEKKGLLVVGFLGGLVSSTAVLLSSARQVAESPSSWRSMLSSSLAAKLASMVELLFIVLFISPTLFFSLVLPVCVGILIGGAQLAVIAKKDGADSTVFQLKSPLNWMGVLRLSVLLGGILAVISVAKSWLGESATMAISFIAGLFELHGVTLANATMHSQAHLGMQAAGTNIIIALIASLVAKIVMAWIVCRGPFSKILTVTFLIIIVALSLATWVLYDK